MKGMVTNSNHIRSQLLVKRSIEQVIFSSNLIAFFERIKHSTHRIRSLQLNHFCKVELFSFDANHPEISRRGHYPWMDETGDGHVLFLVWACAMLSKEMYMLVGNL